MATERILRIELSRQEVLSKAAKPPPEGTWVLAVDPETLEARIVARCRDGYVPDVTGHEDLFPLSMALEREDGIIEGGDWLVASTPEHRAHDGRYRSYKVVWRDDDG